MPESAHQGEGQDKIWQGQINLVFHCQGEFVKFCIDRTNRRFKLTSSKTNYKEQEMEWKMLFDKGKEEQQDEITKAMNDTDFSNIFIRQMALNGYKLVSKDAGL